MHCISFWANNYQLPSGQFDGKTLIYYFFNIQSLMAISTKPFFNL